jgi:RNA polymerase sigma-70 factor (ECF subfamily)
LDEDHAQAAVAAISRADLARRLQEGDQAVIEFVVHAYLGQVLRTARGAGLDGSEAEELAQATFATFIDTAARFEGRSHVRTWLFGILYRKLQEHWRQAGRDRQLDELDERFLQQFGTNGRWLQPPNAPDEALYAREIRRHLSACLQRAARSQRMAFLLRDVQGFSTTEICKILDVSTTNLGVLLHRVRNRLRECLEAKGVRGS